MHKYATQITIGLLTAGLLTFSSCAKSDEESPNNQEISVFDYNFENADYSGQLERIALLENLIEKAESAQEKNTIVSATDLQALFEAKSPNGKQLQDKTNAEAIPFLKKWFAITDTSSQSTVEASNGIAGRLEKSATSIYLFSKTGFDVAEVIEKGVMGACFYYQATGIDGYLSSTNPGEGLLVDNTTNVEGKNYTALQHHWDEAFGYFGAPKTLTATNSTDAKFYAKYSLKGEKGNLNITNDIMKAFYLGRKAINEKNLEEAKKQAAIVKEKWEMAIVVSALSYLNSAAGTNFTSDVNRLHVLTEARMFIWSLNFNQDKKITSSQINELLALMTENFWTVSKTDIENTAKKLAAIYGISESTRLAL